MIADRLNGHHSATLIIYDISCFVKRFIATKLLCYRRKLYGGFAYNTIKTHISEYAPLNSRFARQIFTLRYGFFTAVFVEYSCKEKVHCPLYPIDKYKKQGGKAVNNKFDVPEKQPNRNSIGQFICALRKAMGYTQQEVADRLNVSNKAVSRWERDECAPDITLIPAIAELFGVTCDELLKGERISKSETQEEKKQPKVEKQVRVLLARTLSNFKTLTYISIALASFGFVFISLLGFGVDMDGLALPVTVMMISEVSALTLSVLAVMRIRDAKSDNELFALADSVQLEKFNLTVGNLSLLVFSLIFATLLSFVIGCYAPFLSAVISSVCVTLALGLKFRERYFSWLGIEVKAREPKPDIKKNLLKMNLAQCTLTLVAVILFIVSPYFVTAGNSTDYFNITLNVIAVLCLVGNVVCFVVLVTENRNSASFFLPDGIRNIIFILPALIMSKFHSCTWSGDYSGYTRHEAWLVFEYLLPAVVLVSADIVIFSVIKSVIKKRSEKI